MTTLNIHNETTIKAKGTHTMRNNKPVICVDTGEVFASITDAAEHLGVRSTNISKVVTGVYKTCKGMRFCLLSRATENLDILAGQIRTMNADAEDARKWRAHQAEQEAIRKAEEDRIRAEQERIAAIERAKAEHEERKKKLEARLERRKRIIERIEAELRRAKERYAETWDELDALIREEENEEENVA